LQPTREGYSRNGCASVADGAWIDIAPGRAFVSSRAESEWQLRGNGDYSTVTRHQREAAHQRTSWSRSRWCPSCPAQRKRSVSERARRGEPKEGRQPPTREERRLATATARALCACCAREMAYSALTAPSGGRCGNSMARPGACGNRTTHPLDPGIGSASQSVRRYV
jgi:hypothetical protein